MVEAGAGRIVNLSNKLAEIKDARKQIDVWRKKWKLATKEEIEAENE